MTAWILGGLAVAGVAGLLAVMNVLAGRNKQRTLDEGEPVTGWLVQANTALFEDGAGDYPAVCLISPDPDTAEDEGFMTDLADRIMELKGVDPGDTDDEAEAKVAGLMASEAYQFGRRDRLPKAFTGGRSVYLAHLSVYRDHLPGRKLTGRRLYVAVIWDRPGTLICTRPAPKKKRRRRDDEDDE
ncbi:MAG: hypothetical protein K2X87_26285 [Gemmataceae bacterium]|nr:hypothetical protein [Gemmataceae bacterium]